MKRDLVTFAQQTGNLFIKPLIHHLFCLHHVLSTDTQPADKSTFFETKTPEERKRLAALAIENRNMEE